MTPGHVHVLEDAVVRDLIQEMEPGHEQAAVVGALVGGVQLLEAMDDAVHMPHAAALVPDGQTGGPAQQRGEIQVVVVVDELDLELVGAMHFLDAGEA